VRDQPALFEAATHADTVVPLFVVDDRVLGAAHDAANRLSFLLDSLRDLRQSIRSRGGDLTVARGDTVDETMRLAAAHGADAVFTSADVSAHARRREAALARACSAQRVDFRAFPGVTVIAPGDLRPAGSDHYRVFTPYWRAWSATPRRAVLPAPEHISVPDGLESGSIPDLAELTDSRPSPRVAMGGEIVGRRLLRAWRHDHLAEYGDRHDDLAGDVTSRISPYVHFGCLSPLEIAERLGGAAGAAPFLRQLCWRDFHHQVTAAFPDIAREDYRLRGIRWRTSEQALDAWQHGRTGVPIVDAGMRQLADEGWMHNRARLITASFLTKQLRIDWRCGSEHFLRLLVDGDIANNSGNWQWVAGTGNDTRPNRTFNPLRQATRFDPDGDYVRRYVPELAGVAGARVHRPWNLPRDVRRALDYPEPIVDLQ
jgi:deoxyribodipyrimidine photo-lyase